MNPVIIGDATLYLGDCIEVMRGMPDSSIDSIVTDPPYHLTQVSRGGHARTNNPESPHGRHRIGDKGFMGKVWDGGDIAQRVDMWAEALRVLKPGGHLLAFSGSRTYHRMTCAIEDAGFEVRDQIMWIYGSGFPKSRNLDGDRKGWGTALKPAHEPICVARKPLIGTVAENVATHGVGAINIDGCRVVDGELPTPFGNPTTAEDWRLNTRETDWQPSPIGRWPANVIHDGSEEVISAFPTAPGQLADASTNAGARKFQNVYGAMSRGHNEQSADSDNLGAVGFKMKPGARRLDAGSAARFFYCAKASRTDRNGGCEALPQKPAGFVSNTSGQHMTRRDEGYSPTPVGNNHPTVKPTDLMAYLCRLVTPLGGTVLDPFMGSGSTGKAAMREGFKFIGIDLSPEYLLIAKTRIEHEISRVAAVVQDPQISLFEVTA
jgi:site-specific DNA-methyltransferase (adenine-specific)